MKVSLGKHGQELTGPIHDGTGIRQQFIAKGNKLVSVSVYFATYKRENPGCVHVDIRDSRNQVIVDADIDSTRLNDNSYREFGLDCQLVTGRQYELRVWTQFCRAGLSPTCAYGKNTQALPLFIGRRRIKNGELTCIFNYKGDGLESEEEGSNVDKIEMPLLEDSVRGLISVVIPHYNCPDLLRKCLISLSKQSYSCIELIIVDDGSTEENYDKARDVVDKLSGLFGSVDFLSCAVNGGAPAARNAGADMAKGEYLFFCDADVELYPESFEVLVSHLIDSSAAFSYGGFIWGSSRVIPKPFSASSLRKSNYVTTMSLLRRSCYTGWDENLKRHQDWDLWLGIVDNGWMGVCCGRYLFETPAREGISNDRNIPMQTSREIVQRKHGLI